MFFFLYVGTIYCLFGLMHDTPIIYTVILIRNQNNKDSLTSSVSRNGISTDVIAAIFLLLDLISIWCAKTSSSPSILFFLDEPKKVEEYDKDFKFHYNNQNITSNLHDERERESKNS